VQDLLESYKKVWAIGYAQALLHWDQVNVSPLKVLKGNIYHRSKQPTRIPV